MFHIVVGRASTRLSPAAAGVLRCLVDYHGTIEPAGATAYVRFGPSAFHVSRPVLAELVTAGFVTAPDADGRSRATPAGHAVVIRTKFRGSSLAAFFSAHP